MLVQESNLPELQSQQQPYPYTYIHIYIFTNAFSHIHIYYKDVKGLGRGIQRQRRKSANLPPPINVTNNGKWIQNII